MKDSVDSEQNSGYYGMTVEQTSGLTKQIAFPTEVRAYRGSNIARFEIDLLYDDDQAYERCGSISNDCFRKSRDHMGNKRNHQGKIVFTIVRGRD